MTTIQIVMLRSFHYPPSIFIDNQYFFPPFLLDPLDAFLLDPLDAFLLGPLAAATSPVRFEVVVLVSNEAVLPTVHEKFSNLTFVKSLQLRPTLSSLGGSLFPVKTHCAPAPLSEEIVPQKHLSL